MARVIGQGVTNQADISDSIGGGTVRLFFRTPTTKERVAYHAEAVKMTGGRNPKPKVRVVEIRQKFGGQILTDIEKGNILFQDENGAVAPLTSDVPDWRDKLKEFAPDLVEAVAVLAFEGTAALPPDLEDEGGEAGEDPLAPA